MDRLLSQSTAHRITGGGDTNPAPPPDPLPQAMFLKDATFAAGSFRELEAAFCRSDARPVRTAVGYYGGTVPWPTYREVMEGGTGHTEAVRVTYDRRMTSYKSLCKLFFESHDSTNKDYLKFGAGTHHRSAIFYSTEEEKTQAQQSKVEKQMKLNKRIVTKIVPSNGVTFYLAETPYQKQCLQSNQPRLCELLNLRTAHHFAESHLACMLNGILGLEGKEAAAKLSRFLEVYQLPEQPKQALEEIKSQLSQQRYPIILLDKWEVF